MAKVRGSLSGVTGSRVAMGEKATVQELRIALAREERIAKALREVGNALGTTLDLDELLELILGRLTDLLDADRATLYLLDQSKGELVSRIVIGGQVRSIRVRVGSGIAGVVAETGKPIRLKDAYADSRFESEWDAFTGYRTTSMLVSPLKNHRGRIIGVIQVLNKKVGDEFTAEDEEILAALSTQAAVAIDNSRLFLSLVQKNHQLLSTKEKLERRVSDLQLLNELEQSMARVGSVEELAIAALSALTSACHALGGTLLFAEEDTGDLLQYVYDPRDEGKVTSLGVKTSEGIAASVMATGEPVELGDAALHADYHPRVEGAFSFAVRSCLVLPLSGEPAMGAIGLFSKRGRRAFEEEDRSLMALVGTGVTSAVKLFRASEQRERSQRLTTIGRLLSQVIHDFKTPMSVIGGYAQMMTTENDPIVRAKHAKGILQQFDMLTAMQREVLEFARGEKRIFVRRVYLNLFFQEMEEQLRPYSSAQAISIEVSVDSKRTARFDETRISRAIHNLARNAIEAMGSAGGKLTLSARHVGDDLVIGVGDTGPGIPEQIRGRLFQSFVTAGKQGGTGLGLAIVKKIVDEHRGFIEVLSSDAGATFEMHLPQKVSIPSVIPEAMEDSLSNAEA